MHRSGTSLVARLFFEFGACMGDPDTFYRSDKWNPDGYFEHTDIQSINMSLIHGPYWKFAYFMLPSTKKIISRAVPFKDEIQHVSEKYREAVIKETRFCLTLPAWQQYSTHINKVLFCFRDPFSVARSVKRRNRIPIKRGFALWYTHNQRLLENVGDLPLWFVDYDRLVNSDSYLNEVRAATRFFNLEIDDERLLEVCNDIIKENISSGKEEEIVYPDKVIRLWNELKERHARQFEGY